jgi:hypothetical protein
MGQTDDFLEKVIRMEEEDALRGQNSKKPDPLGEEHLRRNLRFHEDQESRDFYHGWLVRVHHSTVCECGWHSDIPLDYKKLDDGPRGAQTIVYNGHATSRFPDGADRIGLFIRDLVKMIEFGFSDRQIEAHCIRNGFVNKAGDYVRMARILHSTPLELPEHPPSPSADKRGGGQK